MLPFSKEYVASEFTTMANTLANPLNDQWLNTNLRYTVKFGRFWRIITCIITLGFGFRHVRADNVAQSVFKQCQQYSQEGDEGVLSDVARNQAIRILEQLDRITKNKYHEKMQDLIGKLNELRVIITLSPPPPPPPPPPIKDEKKIKEGDEEKKGFRSSTGSAPKDEFSTHQERDVKARAGFDLGILSQMEVFLGDYHKFARSDKLELNNSIELFPTDKGWLANKINFFQYIFEALSEDKSLDLSKTPSLIKTIQSLIIGILREKLSLSRDAIKAAWYTYRGLSLNDIMIEHICSSKKDEFNQKLVEELTKKTKLSEQSIRFLWLEKEKATIQQLVDENKTLKSPSQGHKDEKIKERVKKSVQEHIDSREDEIKDHIKTITPEFIENYKKKFGKAPDEKDISEEQRVERNKYIEKIKSSCTKDIELQVAKEEEKDFKKLVAEFQERKIEYLCTKTGLERKDIEKALKTKSKAPLVELISTKFHPQSRDFYSIRAAIVDTHFLIEKSEALEAASIKTDLSLETIQDIINKKKDLLPLAQVISEDFHPGKKDWFDQIENVLIEDCTNKILEARKLPESDKSEIKESVRILWLLTTGMSIKAIAEKTFGDRYISGTEKEKKDLEQKITCYLR